MVHPLAIAGAMFGLQGSLSKPSPKPFRLIGKPMRMKPHPVSKANTVAQIFLACLVLAALGFRFDAGWLLPSSIALVAVLTLLSIAFYVAEWIRHVGSNGAAH